MIQFAFSVRPDQGEPTGYDLGDIVCSGDKGELSSLGKSPDQGMMIYLTVPQLMSELLNFIESEARILHFIGTDTSFRLIFRRKKAKISIGNNDGIICEAGPRELAEALLLAAESFMRQHVAQLPQDDIALYDFNLVLPQFRRLTAHL